MTRQEEIAIELAQDRGYVTVVVRGAQYGFLPSAYGAKLVRAVPDEGGRPLDAVAAIGRIASALGGAFAGVQGGGREAFVKAATGLTGELLDDVATVVLAGMLPFTPALDHDRVLSWLTPGTAPALFAGIWPAIAGMLPEQNADAESDEGRAAGKPKAARRR